ncbi:putative RNA polymerase ECF-subfamily sigma factor [Streptomyces himastatinicus ATCC 53653]|uniref:Putative RNA polymerase ECF-subfamily sigma factor n=1 Tax=Streptomyces himastatinicus ATCC 53653 TaxID=457427 RepID=D9WWB9_9ACTN|nr:RNA polymerase sigma factor [Streptomyces himastatinicus]EFL26575.1 putative RNA polymerase ECF-subfamily sigma factor [Streptomyces himastatinicus ATCC 53653]
MMSRRLEDEFDAIYRQTRDHVWRYLLRRLPRGEVDDALADVYVGAWSSRRGLRGEPLPWLYGIARHVVARRLEMARKTPMAHVRPAADSAEAQVASRDEAFGALARLSDKEREAVLLIAWEGLTPAEAARAVGCTTAAMTLRLHRARRRLERDRKEADDHN